MRRFLVVMLGLMLTLAPVFAQGNNETKKNADDGKLKVTLLVTGSFGDKAFNDSALAGVNMIKSKLGDKVAINTVEMGTDKSKYESAVLDVADSGTDIIVTGLWEMAQVIQDVAPQYPDKKFILFDTSVDYSAGDYSNVYSISYRQNQAGFLAGVLAAGVTKSDMPECNPQATIGFIGAKENAAVINDSAVGYVEGAKFIDPNIKVLVSYVGSYVDSATAKELALTQYSNGADIVFVAAGPASVGAIEAAFDSQKYIIGVDSDQAAAYADNSNAKYIISSALKNVGMSIYNSISQDLAGTLPYGHSETQGLSSDAVGLAMNSIYESEVPATVKQQVADAKKSLIEGKVKVNTAYGMEFDKLKAIINSAQ
ncbi:MAG: BMP family ABC transporter substrate-binding protein [Spirochaetia bacterium]|jgi:basic membrane protein A|nr:BMP family ABC transporter substrate-binding protein [Spirochaetia bacterium]